MNVPIIHMNDWLKLLEIWISVWCLGVALQLDQDTLGPVNLCFLFTEILQM